MIREAQGVEPRAFVRFGQSLLLHTPPLYIRNLPRDYSCWELDSRRDETADVRAERGAETQTSLANLSMMDVDKALERLVNSQTPGA